MGWVREKNTKDEKYKMGGERRRGRAGEVRDSSHDELGERREKSGNREGREGDGLKSWRTDKGAWGMAQGRNTERLSEHPQHFQKI